MSSAETAPTPVVCPNSEWNESLEHFRSAMSAFVKERDWHTFHTPRNLAFAMVGEVGEIAELLQWRGEVASNLVGWSDKDKHHMGEEISDVFLYLVRFADECGVNLAEAAKMKLKKNALKYPASRCKGSAKKYNEYKEFNEVEVEKETKRQLVQRQLVREVDTDDTTNIFSPPSKKPKPSKD